jgi:hypothetical protein
LAAQLVTGGFGEAAPLLAVPVFVVVLAAVTLASAAVEKAGYSTRRGELSQGSWLASLNGHRITGKLQLYRGRPEIIINLSINLKSGKRHNNRGGI